MRHALRWAVREPRVWLAAVAFVVATLYLLAGQQGGAAWIALAAYPLIATVVVERWLADRPGFPERRQQRRQARYEAQVDEIVRRYERRRRGEPEPPKVPRKERRRQARLARQEQRHQAWVDEMLWRYERQRRARERERERAALKPPHASR